MVWERKLEAQVANFRLITVLTFIMATIAAISIVALITLMNSDQDWVMMVNAAIVVLVVGIFVFMSRQFAAIKSSLIRHEVAQRNMVESAHADQLTGAFSRAHFFRAVEQSRQDARDQTMGYIQLDMDKLKTLNDGNGHACGDRALQFLAENIKDILPDAIFGRLGGDEFGLVIPDLEGLAQLKAVCTRLHQRFKVPFDFQGRSYFATATIGATLSKCGECTVEEMLEQADIALYHGKKQGRNTFVIYSDALRVEARYRRYIERELRAAIMVGQLDVHYQPIFGADANTLVSYEALVRWNHPVRGVISPSQFVPIAEESNLIDKMSAYVLDRVCQDAHLLQAPSVSINISAKQLRRSEFADEFLKRVEHWGADPSRITIEITETVPLVDDGVEKANLKALRQSGFRIAIDDFGSGNASLGYLKKFQFDAIKIDRDFVANIEQNKIDELTIQAILRIARIAGMQVIVEGVETREQLTRIQRLGSCCFQGYFLARPQKLGDLVPDTVHMKKLIRTAA